MAGPVEVPTVGLPSVYDDDGAEREGDEEDEALVRCHGSRTHATRVGPPLLARFLGGVEVTARHYLEPSSLVLPPCLARRVALRYRPLV